MGVGAVVEKADAVVGDALERAVRSHHRRRLTKLGHADVFSAAGPELWVPGALPPRSGNTLEVLIDGEDALTAISDAMDAAESHIHIAGWHLSPEFRLRRESDAPELADQLESLASRVQVRVLLWAGPPVPIFQPTRTMVKSIRDRLTRGGNVRCELDARERTLHCHHEKIVIVDDRIAFVGGIDLSDLSGDRWDGKHHPPRQSLGWHDATTRLRGPIVADVAQHFRERWEEVAKEQIPPPLARAAEGDVTIQLLRTVPEKTYAFAARGEFTIAAGYLRALRSARHFIYLENQFLWSAEIVEVLSDRLRNPPSPDFRVVLVLPARPSNGADTTRGQLGRLLDADDGAGRLLAATLTARGPESSLYVHAKIGVIDDEWLTVGSANLNEHSLFNDTEVNVLTLDPESARRTRLRLWAEHLELSEADIDGEPTAVIDAFWKPFAREQLSRSQAKGPALHRVSELPSVSRRSERLVGPVRGLLVDG